jgi:hypothetical protein
VEFNVEKVGPIEWNEEAFANLVLPSDRKMLLQSLVEAHSADLSGFDDFIKGKGRGLVINLFGPPGVGKTLSAEATSERESTTISPFNRDFLTAGLAYCRCQATTLRRRWRRPWNASHRA